MSVLGRHRRPLPRFGALAGALCVIGTLMLAAAPPASAHPLGNFTVNRYARVEVSSGVVRVYYVLDEAEIPAFQEGTAPTADPAGFARARASELAAHVRLVVDGTPTALTAATPELERPPGQAGLHTLHLAVLFSAPLGGSPTDTHTLDVTDDNQPDHIGWREIIITARGDAHISASTAPAADVSHELTAYPGNLIQSPLDLRHASATFTPGSQAVAPVAFLVPGRAVSRAGAGFASLVNRKRVTVPILGGLLVLALGFGAVHALSPGHGKTIMAAYLVGTRGRPRDAVLLGTIVSLMHTASVLALGGALYAISRNANPDRVYPYLKVVSGLGIGAWGLWLVVQRLRARTRAHPDEVVDPLETPAHHHAVADDHEDVLARATSPALATVAAGGTVLTHPAPVEAGGHHDDDHDHDHPHDHAHDHRRSAGHVHGPGGHTHVLPDDVAPLSRRGLILLATGGGLFPSPSAVLVLISAFELHRTGLGLALIAAFSVGLAVTLTLVGLALVYGRRLVDRRRGFLPALRWLPVASAAAITVLGLAFAANGFSSVR